MQGIQNYQVNKTSSGLKEVENSRNQVLPATGVEFKSTKDYYLRNVK